MNYFMNQEEYLVSVYMTTYYHEDYIAQAIESILKQIVNFSYEIVISDDASKDATQAIIKRYAKKYSFIKYLFNEKNLGLTKNVFQAKMNCSGKYLIQLSGDDYWIDDYKLQEQFDFMEENPQYFGVVTRLECRTNRNLYPDFITPAKSICNKDFTLSDYLKGLNFPTNGLMYKNILNDEYDFFSLMPKMSEYIDDETDCLLILLKGNVFIMDEVTVAYRRRIESETEHNFNSINKGIEKLKKHISLLNNLYANFGSKVDLYNRYKIAFGPEIFKHYRLSTRHQFKEIILSIPNEYLDRHLVFSSALYNGTKAFEVVTRKFRR